MTDMTANTVASNPSFPTAFKVFTSQHTLAEKRFMRKVCECVEASTGMKARSKWNTVAGARLIEGNVTPVSGFNVLVECERKADRMGVRAKFWTQEALLADGDFDVVTIASHAKSLRVDDISATTPQDVVAQLLGAENVVTPSSWDEKASKAADADAEKLQKKAVRELKKVANAQKRDEARLAVTARKAERAQKKAEKMTTKPIAAPAPEVVTEAPVAEPEEPIIAE